MVLISDDGTPAARRRSGSGRPCFESKRRAHQKSGLRGELGHRGPKLIALSASRGVGGRYNGLVRALYQTFLRKEAQTARDAVCAKSRQSLRTSSNRKSYRAFVWVGVEESSPHARGLGERLCAACEALKPSCNWKTRHASRPGPTSAGNIHPSSHASGDVS